MSAEEYEKLRPAIIAEADARETGERWQNRPERWWQNPHFRCLNGHVSTRYLKTEDGNVCFACRGTLWLTFPEDVDDEPAKDRGEGLP